MHRTRRLTLGLVTGALIVGGSVLAAAPANAETYHRISIGGYKTAAECEVEEGAWFDIIADRGGQVYAGATCNYQGEIGKWRFAVLWTEP